MIKVQKSTILNLSILYISLPIIIFLYSWIKIYISLLCIFLFILSLYFFYNKDIKDNKYILFYKKDFLWTIFIILIICFLVGQGGCFVQSWDNHTKNAIFRDLIELEWPIIYKQTGFYLVYYIAYWLIPSLFGKILGWYGANIALFIWSYIGILLTVLCISFCIEKNKKWKLSSIAIFFFVFSGMNILGSIISNIFDLSVYHRVFINTNEGWLDGDINGYASGYLYRSIYDALCQSYNQSIPTWLITSIIFIYKDFRVASFLCILLISYAPIPFIGLFFVIFIAFLFDLYKNIIYKNNILFFIKYISIELLLAVLAIIPVFILYYKCNNSSGFGLYTPFSAWNSKRIISILLFYLLEFLVYSILIYKKYKKDILFISSNIALLIIPLLKIGDGRDFCMNASFSPIFVIFIYTYIYLSDFISINKIKKYAICVIIFIGSCTSLFGTAHNIR